MKILRNTNNKNIIFINVDTVVKEATEEDLESWAARCGRRIDKEDFNLLEDFKKWGALHSEFCQITKIETGIINGDELIIKVYSGEEKDLLLRLNRDLDKAKKINPNISLFGFAVQGFGLPVIFKRSLINGVIPCDLVDSSDLKPWEIQILDLKLLWKTTGYSSSKLINIATALKVKFDDKIKCIADIFQKLTGNSLISKIKYIEIEPFSKKKFLEKIADDGIISVEMETFIIEKAKSMNTDERGVLINVINAMLSNTKNEIDRKLELNILSA